MEIDILSQLIQDKRNQLNLTQQEVADELGVSRQTISKWENGYVKHMGIENVPKYAALLDLPAIAFIYPETYLDSKYIDHEYIEMAKKLQANNISIKSLEKFTNLVSEIKLDLFKEIR